MGDQVAYGRLRKKPEDVITTPVEDGKLYSRTLWIVVAFVIVVLACLIYVLFIRKKEEDPSPTPTEKGDTPLVTSSTLLINGTSSASPNLSTRARDHAGMSITTAFHPFIIKEDGATYMPESDWWLMRDTQHACLGFTVSSYIFLTSHGIYHCSPQGSVRLCECSTPEKVRLTHVCLYDDVLYTVGEDGHVYTLLSHSEFNHHCGTLLSPGKMADVSKISLSWYWNGAHHLYGLDLRGVVCRSLEVIHNSKKNTSRTQAVGTNKRDDSLYLFSDRGIYRWKRSRWDNVSCMSRNGLLLKYGRGDVRAVSHTGEVVRHARGRVGALCGDSSVLYTIDNTTLYRTASDMANVPMSIGMGWVDLIMLEDGQVIGISSDMTIGLNTKE